MQWGLAYRHFVAARTLILSTPFSRELKTTHSLYMYASFALPFLRKKCESNRQLWGRKKLPCEPRLSECVLQARPVSSCLRLLPQEPACMSLRYQFQTRNICQVFWSQCVYLWGVTLLHSETVQLQSKQQLQTPDSRQETELQMCLTFPIHNHKQKY